MKRVISDVVIVKTGQVNRRLDPARRQCICADGAVVGATSARLVREAAVADWQQLQPRERH